MQEARDYNNVLRSSHSWEKGEEITRLMRIFSLERNLSFNRNLKNSKFDIANFVFEKLDSFMQPANKDNILNTIDELFLSFDR